MRKIVLGLVTIGSAYVAAGAILDSVSNAMALITLHVTVLGTLCLILLWFGLRILLKQYPISWGTYRIKRLGYYPACGFIGILLLLWTPPLFKKLHPLSPTIEKSNQESLPRSKSAKVVVLVTEFAGSNPQGYGVTDIVFEQLTDAVKDYSDVKIERINESMGNADMAKSRGRDWQADIVLWGSYLTNNSMTMVTVHFETMYKTVVFQSFTAKDTVVGATTRLESFTIQDEVSQHMRFLVLVTIGLIRVDLGDFKAALDIFSDALTLKPYPRRVVAAIGLYDYRALCYVMLNRVEDALSDLTTALKFEKNPALLRRRGQVYFLLDKNNKALFDLNESIRLDDKDDVSYLLRSTVHNALGDSEMALVDAEKAVEIDRYSLLNLLNRMEVYISHQRFDSAISDGETITAVCEKLSGKEYPIGELAPCPSYFPLSAMYEDVGDAYAGKGDYEKAFAGYTLAIRTAPQNELLFQKRGKLHLFSGQFQDAIQDFGSSISLDPDDCSVYLLRAEAYKGANDVENTLADYAASISKGPRQCGAVAFLARGKVNVQRERLYEAVSDFTRSIEIEPLNLAYLQRCMTYGRLEQFDLAISDCSKVISLDNKNSEAYMLRAAALTSKRKFAQAIRDYDIAIKIKPNDPEKYYGRALAHEFSNDKQRAIGDYEKFLALKRVEGSETEKKVAEVKERLCNLRAGNCQ